MQRRLARAFIAWTLGSLLFAMVCITYIYALPSPVAIASLDEVQQPQISVASKPSRLAFIAYGEDSTVRAFWKDPEGDSVRFTIEIDPGSSADETSGEVDATDDATGADPGEEPESADSAGNGRNDSAD